jgi:hypothetical protein
MPPKANPAITKSPSIHSGSRALAPLVRPQINATISANLSWFINVVPRAESNHPDLHRIMRAQPWQLRRKVAKLQHQVHFARLRTLGRCAFPQIKRLLSDRLGLQIAENINSASSTHRSGRPGSRYDENVSCIRNGRHFDSYPSAGGGYPLQGTGFASTACQELDRVICRRRWPLRFERRHRELRCAST